MTCVPSLSRNPRTRMSIGSVEWRRAAPPFDRAPIGRVELERCSTIWRSPIAERACLTRPVERDRDVEPRSDLMARVQMLIALFARSSNLEGGHRILVSRLESCPPTDRTTHQRPPRMSPPGATVVRCAWSGCLVRAATSSGPSRPRRVASGCAVGAAVRR